MLKLSTLPRQYIGTYRASHGFRLHPKPVEGLDVAVQSLGGEDLRCSALRFIDVSLCPQ